MKGVCKEKKKTFRRTVGKMKGVGKDKKKTHFVEPLERMKKYEEKYKQEKKNRGKIK